MGNDHTPGVRFPGFSGDWDERKLGDLVIDVGRPLKMVDDDNYQLVTVKRRNGGIVSRGIYKGSEVLVKSQFIIKTGDYLISKRQVVHGANGIVPEFLDGSIVSNEYLVLHGTKDLSIEFFSLISELPSMYKMFFLSSYGVDIEKLVFNVLDWKKRKIPVPSILEQNQITSFVNAINNAIAIHHQELTTLRQTKQGFLQKMFPKEGESVPEVRFPGFTDAWEQRKLGEVAEIKDSARIPNSKWQVEGVPYLRSSDLSSSRIGGELFLSIEDYEAYAQKTGVPEIGDLLFASGGDIGLAVYKDNDTPVYVQGGSILYVKTSKSKSLLGLFLKYAFESPKVLSYIKGASTGTSLKHFVLKPANALPISFPTLIEQQKIGEFFNQLDHLITLNQRELEVLQVTKKAFLQKMFV
ncbi:restriction endonuclease subunit S [Sporosarcina sp. FSL K6-1522]|uniref:restriction endonuclease subunit S n=1 Tax=Sporosarcina sp. FSL K6-1522 TaxID=2921554 RepID=UPI00315A37B6